MYNKVYVCEKNELVEALVSALPAGFKKQGHFYSDGKDAIVGCIGHMIGIAPPDFHDENLKKWSLDTLPFYFDELKYQTDKSKKDRLKVIYDLLGKANSIVHVGDPDDEGQLIVDELIRAKRIKKPVQRLLINDINEEYVRKELTRMKDNNDLVHLGFQAMARAQADYYYGLNLTRLFTKVANNGSVLSVGRVFTAIFSMIYMRENQNINFIASDYYRVFSICEVAEGIIKFNYVKHQDDETDDSKSKRLINLDQVKQLCEKLAKNQSAEVIKKEIKPKITQPPLPYNLLVLQSDCYKQFGYSPKQVKEITQGLREKYKAITYNRSDCQYLNDEHFEEADLVLNTIGNNLPTTLAIIQSADATIKSRAFNSKKTSAHHAIIPTKNKVNTANFTDEELNVYKIICRNYMIQFLPPLEEEVTTLTIQIDDRFFTASKTKLIKAGFTKIYKTGATREKDIEDDGLNTESMDESSLDLNSLNQGDFITLNTVDYDVCKTEPLPLYTMNTLLDDLPHFSKYVKDPSLKKLLIERDKDKKGEHGGIGTPATRDEIIDNLFKRNVIELKAKKIVTTELGKEFMKILPEEVVNADLTALWYQQQLDIRNEEDVKKFVKNVHGSITDICNKIKGQDITFNAPSNVANNANSTPKKGRGASSGTKAKTATKSSTATTKAPSKGSVTDIDCPTCNKGKLRRIKNNANQKFFYGCTCFPECKASYAEFDNKPYIKKVD